MLIHSVKLDVGAKTVALSFSRKNGLHDEKVPSFTCPDDPTRGFVEAMKALKGDFCYLMELPKELHDKVTVHGVVFGEQGGRDHFQILGGYNPDIGYCSLNTPRLWAPAAEGIQGATVLTDEQTKRLRKVRIEAAKYADGTRKPQTELKLEDGGAGAEAEEAATADA